MKIYTTIKGMEEKSEFLKGLVEKYIKELENMQQQIIKSQT